MTRRDVLTARICAAILANPNINPLTASAADVVHQARRVLDRFDPPLAKGGHGGVGSAQPSTPANGTPANGAPANGNHAPIIVPAPFPTTPIPEPRNGGWLYRMAEKRGALDWFNAFGREHGYPRRIVEWSDGMVKLALDARRAQNGTAATNGRAR